MVFILELIGTVAFAFSGCMVANSKKMDIFGVWVLGTVTAVGGGAVRDVLLGIFPPNMFRHGSYVAVATLTVALWLLMAARKGTVSRAIFKKLTWIMDISDSIGLGIFAVVGSQTAINVGYGDNWFLVIFVGVMTGVGGGLLRGLVDRGVVGVGLAVLFGVLLQAFPGELVEAAVVDRVGIGDQGQLSLAAGNRSGSFAALSVGRGVLGVLGVVIAGAGASGQGQDHDKRENQTEDSLFHVAS